jgi:ubiquinone/menaquinone biosynthesis C-methylase UbiE
LSRLDDVTDKDILLCGIGTGLDIPHLPVGARYTGIDLTPAMLARAQVRLRSDLDLRLESGDVMQLPYKNAMFDHVIMHLILAVVPAPEQALQEACRVLKPGGKIYILDKFLRPGQLAPLRRTLNLIIRHVATRTDVVFESVLQQTPSLSVLQDEDCFAGGWFRTIIVEKKA